MPTFANQSRTQTTCALIGFAVLGITCFLFLFRQAEWWYIDPTEPPGSIHHCDMKLTIWKPNDLIPRAEWRGLWIRRGGMWSEAVAERSSSIMGMDYITSSTRLSDGETSSLLLIPTLPTTLIGLLVSTLAIYPAARRHFVEACRRPANHQKPMPKMQLRPPRPQTRRQMPRMRHPHLKPHPPNMLS